MTNYIAAKLLLERAKQHVLIADTDAQDARICKAIDYLVEAIEEQMISRQSMIDR